MPKNQLMIDPAGEVGEVAPENVSKALAQKYRYAVRLRAPNGNVEIVSHDLAANYLAAGFVIVHEQ